MRLAKALNPPPWRGPKPERLSEMASTKIVRAYNRSRIPLYLQVAAVIRQRIESGCWSFGEQIPTLDQLEKEFQVARVTIRQAIDVLRDEELVKSRQGRGTFVAKKTYDKRWLRLATDWRSLAESLRNNVPRMISGLNEQARQILHENDGAPADGYVFLRSVQFKSNEPYGIVNLQLAKSIFDRDPKSFLSRPALPMLAERDDISIKTARQSITVGEADPESADLLQIALGAPIVNCRCVVTDASDIAIYGAEIIYRSDCIKLDIDLLAGAEATSPAPACASPDSNVKIAQKAKLR